MLKNSRAENPFLSLSLSHTHILSKNMHRQSLGSPASSKIQIQGIAPASKDDGVLTVEKSGDGERGKSQKAPQHKPSPRLIHLIPVLTLVCFLILYLSSHDPSRRDSVDEIGGVVKVENGGATMAVRSMRNLQEIGKRHLHRKIRHF